MLVEAAKNYRISLLESVPCVEVVWIGTPTHEAFRRACNLALDLLVEKGWSKVLTDNRACKVFSVEDVKWLNSEWLPRAQRLGYRCSASIVNASDVFTQFAVTNVIKGRDSGHVSSKMFFSRAEAELWLLSF